MKIRFYTTNKEAMVLATLENRRNRKQAFLC